MVQLQGDLKKIEAAGVRVVGISYDSVKILKKFSDGQSLGFPLLSDDGSRTIRAYGIANPTRPELPLPGTFLIDRSGVVRAKLFEEGYRERHSVDDLIAAAGKVD